MRLCSVFYIAHISSVNININRCSSFVSTMRHQSVNVFFLFISQFDISFSFSAALDHVNIVSALVHTFHIILSKHMKKNQVFRSKTKTQFTKWISLTSTTTSSFFKWAKVIIRLIFFYMNDVCLVIRATSSHTIIWLLVLIFGDFFFETFSVLSFYGHVKYKPNKLYKNKLYAFIFMSFNANLKWIYSILVFFFKTKNSE